MDTFDLIAAERRRLADELDQLGDADWAAPSRCEGWTNATVAAHLNLAWGGRRIDLLTGFVKARGNLGTTIDRASRGLAATLDPAAAVALLRGHAEDRTVPPTMPPEAPLTDVLVHGADILRPLGRAVAVAPAALMASLGFLVGPKAGRGFRSASLDGLTLAATDLDWRWTRMPATGDAAVVEGPALALAGLLCGRRDHLPEVSGDGVDTLAARL